MSDVAYRDDEDDRPLPDDTGDPTAYAVPPPIDNAPPPDYPVMPAPYTGPLGPIVAQRPPRNFYPQNPPVPVRPAPPPAAQPPPRTGAAVAPQPAPAARTGAAVAPQPVARPGPFGLPPFQRAQRQVYVPPFPNRPPHMWGQPPQYGMLPEPWQIPMIFQGLAGQLGMWGSGSPQIPGSTQYLAGNMGMFSGAYMKGYLSGQSAVADLKYKQLRQTSAELELQQERELREYGDIFAEYQDGRDPQGFMQALFEKANEIHDLPMLRALQLGPDAVMDLQRYRDSKYQTTHAANAAMKKEAGKAAAWPSSAQEETATATPGGTGAPGLGTPGGRAVTAAAGPYALDQFGRPLPTPPVRAQTGTTDAEAGRLADGPEEADARAEYRGQKWSQQGIPADALSRIQHRAGQLRDLENRALDTPGTPAEKLGRLAEVDPGLADEVQGALNYQARIGYGREGMLPRVAQLALRIDKTWNQGVYQYIQEFRNPNGWEQRGMQRAGPMGAAGKEVLRTAKDIIDKYGIEYLDTSTGWQNVNAFIEKSVKGKPEFTEFISAYNAYIQEMVAVTRGGTGNEGDIVRAYQIARPTTSIRQVLGALKTDANIAAGRLEYAKKTWDRNTQGRQGEAPGYIPETVDTLTDIGGMDPNTMKFLKTAKDPSLHDLEPGGRGTPADIEREKEQREGVPKEAVETRKDRGKIIYKMPDGKWYEAD